MSNTTTLMVGVSRYQQEYLSVTWEPVPWNSYLSVPKGMKALGSLYDSGVPIRVATPVAAQGGATVSGSNAALQGKTRSPAWDLFLRKVIF